MISKATRAMLPATNTMSASSRLRIGSMTVNGFGMRFAHDDDDSECGLGWPVLPAAAARDCLEVVAMTSLLSQRSSRRASRAGSISFASAELFSIRYVANPNHMKSYHRGA